MAETDTHESLVEGLSVPEAVTIIGAGGIGSWLAYFSALSGVRRLVLYAPGQIKPGDINRFPVSPQLIGKATAYALAHTLLLLRPDLDLRLHEKYIPGVSEDLDGVVFNCASSENRDFDRAVFQAATARQLRYISGYYTPHDAFVVTHYDDTMPAPGTQPTAVWPAVIATTASLMVAAAFYGSDKTKFGVNLKTLQASDLDRLPNLTLLR